MRIMMIWLINFRIVSHQLHEQFWLSNDTSVKRSEGFFYSSMYAIGLTICLILPFNGVTRQFPAGFLASGK